MTESIYGKYADYLSLILEDFSQRIQEKNDLTKKETGYKLFEHLISRVKTPESMVEKCQRKGFEISTESALRQIRDSIGLRIVCGLKRCADELASCDLTMQTIRNLIQESSQVEGDD